MTDHSFLANLMLILMALSLAIALVAVAWSSYVSLQQKKRARSYRHQAMKSSQGEGSEAKQGKRGLSGRNVTVIVAAGTILLLLITFLLASASPLMINGQPFESGFWLRAADMFIVSSVVLLIVAAAVYAYAEYVSKKLSHSSYPNDQAQDS